MTKIGASMHSISRYSTWLAALALVAGCDSTVGLDPTRPTFTKAVVPGACAATDNLQSVDISLLLLDGTDAILPDDRLSREIRPVSELLTRDSFTFSKLDTAAAEFTEPAFAEGENSGESSPVNIQAEAVKFLFTGGAERKDDDKLVVFILDHSGSLIGENPRTGMIDVTTATDRADSRISFFVQLLGSLPSSWYVSLVSFSALTQITEEFSTPTRNRDLIRDGLTQLQTQEGGTSALADSIEKAYRQIIASPQNADLNPIIVLFTDGTEEGDVSTNSLADAKAKLLAHDPPVPVIVLELQPPVISGLPRGRNPELVNLACETGGEYVFLERADKFTDSTSNLQSAVRNRLVGVWRVTTETSLGRLPDDNYLMSTELGVTLGTNNRSVRLAKARNGNDFNDTRLWFTK